jgi:hypothetical protein
MEAPHIKFNFAVFSILKAGPRLNWKPTQLSPIDRASSYLQR